MRMGCGSSKKLLPESPSDRVVKTTLLAEGTSSRETRSSGNKNRVKRKLSERRNRGAKYRARFDSRVTEKYEIKALIGRGSFSRVVRVEHIQTKQPYAIKMIEIVDGKDVFQSELAVLRKVKHDYVVRLYEVYECRDRIYLVMELATGGELFDRIVSKGFFTERDATRVMYMVLEGVRYLHTLGITHRDLKPENLLYYHPGNESKIMITDFGLSNLRKNPDDRTMETTCGTPEYIAPEILRSKPYTNSVDMWAIGVISYILLSGQMPFSEENRTRLYKAILKAKYTYTGEPWDDVTDMAKDFISKLIILEPGQRMTAEQGLTHPWIASSAASSSLKNLHGSISTNWLKSSSRVNSAKSSRSYKSNRSIRSVLSRHSLHNPSHPLRLSDLKEKLAESSLTPNSVPQQGSSNETKEMMLKQKHDVHERMEPIVHTQDVHERMDLIVHKQNAPEGMDIDSNTKSLLQNKDGTEKETIPHKTEHGASCSRDFSHFTARKPTHLQPLPVFANRTEEAKYVLNQITNKPTLTETHSTHMDTTPSSDFAQTSSSLRNNFLGNFRASNEPISKEGEEQVNYGLEVGISNLTANCLDHGGFQPRLSPVLKRNKVSCSIDNFMS